MDQKRVVSVLLSALSAAAFIGIGIQSLNVGSMVISQLSPGIGFFLLFGFSLLVTATGILLSVPWTRRKINEWREIPWWGYVAAVLVLLAVSYFVFLLTVMTSNQLALEALQQSMNGMNQTLG